MKYAVYGSLMRGFWNHDRAMQDAEYLRTSTVPGYQLGDNGAFPAAFESDSMDDLITVEVYNMANVPKRMREAIDAMEFGCGYIKRMVVTSDNDLVTMYEMPEAYRDHFPYAVPTGNWRDLKEEDE